MDGRQCVLWHVTYTVCQRYKKKYTDSVQTATDTQEEGKYTKKKVNKKWRTKTPQQPSIRQIIR